jgi:transposase
MGVCYGTISNINRGKRYTKEGYDYPIRKTKKKTNKFNENEIQEIYQLLQNPTLSFKDIAQLKNCSVDTIKRLNSG